MTTILQKDSLIDLLHAKLQTVSPASIKKVQSPRAPYTAKVVYKGNSVIDLDVANPWEYTRRVRITQKGKVVDYRCSCLGYTPCSHMIASMLHLAANPKEVEDFQEMALFEEEGSWLKNLQIEEKATPVEASDNVAIYILKNAMNSGSLFLELAVTKLKKNGEFKLGKAKSYPIDKVNDWPDSLRKSLQDGDWKIVQQALKSKMSFIHSCQPPLPEGRGLKEPG